MKTSLMVLSNMVIISQARCSDMEKKIKSSEPKVLQMTIVVMFWRISLE